MVWSMDSGWKHRPEVAAWFGFVRVVGAFLDYRAALTPAGAAGAGGISLKEDMSTVKAVGVLLRDHVRMCERAANVKAKSDDEAVVRLVEHAMLGHVARRTPHSGCASSQHS